MQTAISCKVTGQQIIDAVRTVAADKVKVVRDYDANPAVLFRVGRMSKSPIYNFLVHVGTETETISIDPNGAYDGVIVTNVVHWGDTVWAVGSTEQQEQQALTEFAEALTKQLNIQSA